MNVQKRLDALLKVHRSVLIECAKQLTEKQKWSPIDCPVVVVDARKSPSSAQVCSVGTLSQLVPASAAIDIPEIKEWLELSRRNGHEDAFSEMLSRRGEDVGCRFAEGYGLLQTERREGSECLWSANDLSHFVVKTREAFPNAIGCLALFTGEDGLNHGVITFESEIKQFL
ncbi:hypothetical protein [Synechococcus sp. UW179A]|uniref:hypothetical protein n=1 Tax=Synechococcus sp. UW179A TaxID=2575510 RepID=UPI000E0F9843|nr:hypothetical protein [Synechococcus sp. UW179A]